MEKVFHISDVLSLATGAMLSRTHFPGVSAIVEHVLARDLNGMDFEEADNLARTFLHEAMPWTKDISPPQFPSGASNTMLREYAINFCHEAAKEHGQFHAVPQMQALR